MSIASRVKPKLYQDSVRLMQISQQLSAAEGVEQGFVAMATEANKRVLEEAGLLTEPARQAAANDLLIVVEAGGTESAERALDLAEELLSARAPKPDRSAAGGERAGSLDEALTLLPGANLMLISVPGAYAALEAARALDAGLHVFLFSDNVSLENELALKRRAVDRGLLLMGPGCGTAILDGVALGFANVVRRGPVGIVGASGTGLQEVTTLLDRAGVGVAQAIGVGGRDLSAAIGGLMMRQAIRMLLATPEVEVLVVISKPPAGAVREAIFAELEGCGKPVVVNFLGDSPGDSQRHRSATIHSATFEETARRAAELATGQVSLDLFAAASGDEARLTGSSRLTEEQRYVRGLYSGGSLCDEAMLILAARFPRLYSNIPLRTEWALEDAWKSREHTLVDLGEEEFTQGRPHPMIDLGLRQRRILDEAKDPQVAVILLDVVIGFGCHRDPAGCLAETIREARAAARAGGRHLAVVASICGTAADPQGRSAQEATLADAGALVLPTNAQAARAAAAIAARGAT